MNGNPTEAPPTDVVPPEPALDTRRRRILFRATHRGMQETDRLLGGFVAARIAAFTSAELDEVEHVLTLVDADLADWLLGRRPIPAAHDGPMLRRMLAAAHNAKTP